MIGFVLGFAQVTSTLPIAPSQTSDKPEIVEADRQAQLTIPVGTVIQLRSLSELSTKKNRKGDTFEMAVSEEVVIDGRVAIPEGTIAVGQLTRSDPKGAFGESGKLEARVLYVKLPQGTVRLSGRLGAAGEGGTAATVVTAVLVGTLAFAVTGKSAVIPEGASLVASTDRSVTIHTKEENSQK